MAEPNKTPLLLGWLIGRQLSGLKKTPTPVAYMYNGVRLPALPELSSEDQKKYRYIFLHEAQIGQGYYLWFTPIAVPMFIIPESMRPLTIGWPSGERPDGLTYWCNPDVEKYNYWADSTKDFQVIAENAVWANHNIYNTDSTLYLAASEPVPVYE